MKETQDIQQKTLDEQGLKRRQIVLGLLASVGAVNIAGCVSNLDMITKTVTPPSQNLIPNLDFYSEEEYLLVGRLADIIIPDTQTLGAFSIGVPILMDKFHQTWASVKSQKAHQQAIRIIHSELNVIANTGFLTLSNEQQKEALQTLDDKAFAVQMNKYSSYRKVKKLIANFYYLSEAGATQELRYETVPGRWESCIPFKEIGRTWAV
jgi:hypothetical protein